MRPDASVQLVRQWRVLLEISVRPRSASSLARQFSVSKSTAQRDIDTLAAVFAVQPIASPRHKQRRMYRAVMPTERGSQ